MSALPLKQLGVAFVWLFVVVVIGAYLVFSFTSKDRRVASVDGWEKFDGVIVSQKLIQRMPSIGRGQVPEPVWLLSLGLDLNRDGTEDYNFQMDGSGPFSHLKEQLYVGRSVVVRLSSDQKLAQLLQPLVLRSNGRW